ncbi:MAG: peptidoglycan DD-metalloendopeptidase family protein [Bacteroidales bacterium]|nr:peptidoglycan DD-metalloendopeptidase family protein [Bacteroidales bacterium]
MRKVLHIALVALVLLAGTSPASAQKKESRKSLESQISKIEKDIELLNNKLKDNSRSSQQALSSLTLVQGKVASREKLITECDQSIRVLDDSIKVCQKELDRLQARYDTLSLYYNRLVRNAYKNRDSRMWYMYVLSSESMGQALRRFGYLRRFASQMSDQAKRIQETEAELEVERERLTGLKEEAAELRSKTVQERAKLRDEEAEAARMVNQLKKDRNKFQQQLQEKNRQKQALNKKIAEIIRAEQEAAKKAASGKKGSSGSSSKKTTSTEIDTKLSNEFASNKGKLPWPVEGVIVDRFGKHRHPVYENVEMQNDGVTLTVKRGSQVKAVFNGTVTRIFVMPGYNQCVLVSHGNYYTMYTMLKTVSVKLNQKISTGDVIGTVDTIGGEDQFHFELWKDVEPQNPESWLRK